MRRKIQRARKKCAGAQTTIASRTPRSSRSGNVRAAFSAVVVAASSATSSTSGPRQRSRIGPASDAPLKTTRCASTSRATRSASRTSRSRTRVTLLPGTTTAGGVEVTPDRVRGLLARLPKRVRNVIQKRESVALCSGSAADATALRSRQGANDGGSLAAPSVETISGRVGSAAAGARAAVAARVAGTCSHHAATAAVALDRVLVWIEQRGLARGRLDDGLRLAARVPLGHLGADFHREDAGLFLLVDVEELLAEPAEDVVGDRLRGADVCVVRRARWLEAEVRQLRHVHLGRHAVLQAHRDRDHQRVHQALQRRPILGDVDEDVARRAVVEHTDVDVPLVLADAELAPDLVAVV